MRSAYRRPYSEIKMVRFLVGIAISLCVVGATSASDQIPDFLVGVWATDESVMKGPLLFEGQAIYLGSDGIGASLAGPPPIGVKIVARFNTETSTLEFDMYEGGRRGPHASVLYDWKGGSLDLGAPKHQLLHRRYETFNEDTKKALGL